MSDWNGYANGLRDRLSYTNTYYHQPPLLDIVKPPAELLGTCDFLISTDVFEHVPPPVYRAYQGAFDLLKPGGLLILTVPYTDAPRSIEHFPDLHAFKVIEISGEYVLVNRATNGQYVIHTDLVFHGGPGDTLEMRIPSLADTLMMLKEAGFTDVTVQGAAAPQWGILLRHHHGLPITARRSVV